MSVSVVVVVVVVVKQPCRTTGKLDRLLLLQEDCQRVFARNHTFLFLPMALKPLPPLLSFHCHLSDSPTNV